ncbi:uncharacterized protein LOC124920645 isoform X2 [Impatiens glandulifera]|nr:uncharacterized protein LOC124920645 isoform X2 [Impatiens glandulifera]
MRAVIMVDYGGKMPELQQHLCDVLKLSQQESPIFKQLSVMVIEDMIYLIHLQGLAEFARTSLESELLFVDIENNPPQMISLAAKNTMIMELISVQKFFATTFPVNEETNEVLPPPQRTDSTANPSSSDFIDLSSCLQETEITIPTLNGWLLGYPVVYLFSKDHIADAVYNLSTISLHLYKFLIHRTGAFDKGRQLEELTSFSVPYDLSLEGHNEPWAKKFLASMEEKQENYKQVFSSLHMEVSSCYPQSIAL